MKEIKRWFVLNEGLITSLFGNIKEELMLLYILKCVLVRILQSNVMAIQLMCVFWSWWTTKQCGNS